MEGIIKYIAIITARGGSKRIYKKNIKLFNNRPIIQYSIEAAIESGIFDEIMVSTDDMEIAEIAKSMGVRVPFMRSEKNSNDYATTAEVLLEVLDEYKKLGMEFGKMCCIYPTAPFITAEKLQQGMGMLTGEVDSVVPIVPFSFPPQRGFILNDSKIEFKWPENSSTRSQDLEKMYHDCGQFYCINVGSFYREKCLIMSNTVPIIFNDLEVQDIDNEDDWKMAELKYRIMTGKKTV